MNITTTLTIILIVFSIVGFSKSIKYVTDRTALFFSKTKHLNHKPLSCTLCSRFWLSCIYAFVPAIVYSWALLPLGLIYALAIAFLEYNEKETTIQQ